MSDNLTTPVAVNTVLATKDLGGGVQAPKNVLIDQAGADAMGLVAASPAASTILGRLKTIGDALLAGIGITAAALPLPAGASTSANQAAGNTSLANVDANTAAAAPASTGGTVVTSDTTVLAMRALWVGSGGDVTATIGGGDVVFKNVPSGTLLPIKATKIKLASTASNMVWLG
jgi:hypothetical protein